MLKWTGIATASILAAFVAAPLAADEPATTAASSVRPASDPPPAPVKTGKEHLSSKASDEQRVDNCKVPPELRGATPRPDGCDTKAQPIPTN